MAQCPRENGSCLDRKLPEEIKSQIVSHLDIEPPSCSATLQEKPRYSQIFNHPSPLKELSLVSKDWSARVRPVLFKNLRISLDRLYCHEKWTISSQLIESLPLKNGPKCQGYRNWFVNGRLVSCRLLSIEKGRLWLERKRPCLGPSPEPEHIRFGEVGLWLDEDESEGDEFFLQDLVEALLDFHGSSVLADINPMLRELCNVAERHHCSRISSQVVVCADRQLLRPTLTLPLWRSRRLIWEPLFSCLSLDPQRLIILTTPRMLGYLVTCFIDDTDEWAFDIPYQRLVLEQPDDKEKDEYEVRRREYDASDPANKNSVLFDRMWTAIRYDEGCSLNNYGTYHYFDRVSKDLLMSRAAVLKSYPHPSEVDSFPLWQRQWQDGNQ